MRSVLLLSLLFASCFPSSIFAKESPNSIEPATTPPPNEIFYEILDFERVVDGDTFQASGRTIRVWGINAPERNQPLHRESSLALGAFLETGILRCKQIEKDKYRRDVMHCYSGNNDIGALMVKSGFASDFAKYSGGFYHAEQAFAKESKLGIWDTTLNIQP